MTSFLSWFNSIKHNPVFVTAWTFFAGALGKALVSAVESGHVDFTVKNLQEMVIAALSTTAVALIHLYLPSPTQQPPTA